MNFETLIREEQEGLTRRLTRTLGGDREAAEDVRQEAFARAWRSLPRDLDPDRQRAWLRLTAGNLALDELRRRSRRPTVSLGDRRQLRRSPPWASPTPPARRSAG